MAAPQIPAKPPEAPAKTELEQLREQVAALTKLMNETREPGQARAKVPAKPMARAPWEEDILVEALIDCTYSEPHDPSDYGVYRYGRKDSVDDKGNPIVVQGSIFRLKHREHLNRFLRQLTDKEVDSLIAPAPFVPQTTARSQRVLPVR